MENSSVSNDKMFRFLVVLAISAAAGLLGWRTLLNNFAVEVANLEGHHIGLIQGFREVPGFLTLFVIYLLLLISEVKMASVSIIVFGLGIMFTGFFPGFIGLLTFTIVMSFGFHFYATIGQSLALQYYDQATAPIMFGRIRSYSAAGSVCMAIVLFIVSDYMSFSQMFGLVGFFIILAGIWSVFQDPTDKSLTPQRRKLVFRSRYWLYYMLTFLAGARRQIFVAFSIFLLVQKFHYTVRQISILFIITNVLVFFISPKIGQAISKFGERKILSLEYASLIVIFSVYAFTDNKILVAAMYVLDNIFFNFAMAINTYFQKIGDKADIQPSMAVGFTINHIAAVVIPVLGGIAWMINYKITFMGGVILAACSLVLTQFIRTPQSGANEVIE